MNFLLFRPQTELEFLSRQTLEFAVGEVDVNGTMCTITPASGLTFVLVSAQVSIGRKSTTINVPLVTLRNDGTIIEQIRGIGGGSGGLTGVQYIFQSKGNNLEGDGVAVFDFNVSALAANTARVTGTIIGFLRNT